MVGLEMGRRPHLVHPVVEQPRIASDLILTATCADITVVKESVKDRKVRSTHRHGNLEYCLPASGRVQNFIGL